MSDSTALPAEPRQADLRQPDLRQPDLHQADLHQADLTRAGGEPLDAAVPRPGDGPSKRLYRWTLSLAETPSAPWALAIIAFAESSFFPIPPDVILVPMALARPRRAWAYALICTIGSVLGALLGYAIGALLYNTIGQWLIHVYGYEAKMAEATAFFQKWGALAILVKGLTPIPFKLVTITSGVFKLNLAVFALTCAITRSARFFLVALMMNRFGETVKRLLERYFGLCVLIFLAAIVAGFYIATKVI